MDVDCAINLMKGLLESAGARLQHLQLLLPYVGFWMPGFLTEFDGSPGVRETFCAPAPVPASGRPRPFLPGVGSISPLACKHT